jgi:hypothetical protein
MVMNKIKAETLKRKALCAKIAILSYKDLRLIYVGEYLFHLAKTNIQITARRKRLRLAFKSANKGSQIDLNVHVGFLSAT